MTKRVKVEELQNEIVKAIQEYTEDVSAAIEKEVQATANKVRDEIRANSPVRKGPKGGGYKKGWTRKKTGRGGRVEHTVYNKAKGWLAHLLEFGHAKRGGVGRVPGRPHMEPGYDKHAPDMERRIEKIIRDGG